MKGIIDRHYKHYPMMSPYVGGNYGAKKTLKLLLVGESHYLHRSESQHASPSTWYEGSAKTLKSAGWIDLKSVFNESRENRFAIPQHSIWRNSLSEINRRGPNFSDFTQVADFIAFYNFFLRPGGEGCSLEVKKLDVEMANAAFQIHFATLQPDAVVFLSTLASRHFSCAASFPVPLIFTPHPGCAWWNRKAKRYGNKRGRDVLGDFIDSTWPKSKRAAKA